MTVQLRFLGSAIFEFSDSSVLTFEVDRERLGFNVRDMYRKSVLHFFSHRFGRHQAMDAIIRQALREEISRQNRNEPSQTAAASYIYATSNSSLRSTSVIRQSVRDEISRQNNKLSQTNPPLPVPMPGRVLHIVQSNVVQSADCQDCLINKKGRRERSIRNTESKFGGFITVKSHRPSFQFVKRTLEETALLLIAPPKLPQLKS